MLKGFKPSGRKDMLCVPASSGQPLHASGSRRACLLLQLVVLDELRVLVAGPVQHDAVGGLVLQHCHRLLQASQHAHG